jgi:hypothetical protein
MRRPMDRSSTRETEPRVTVGVDTHADQYVAAALSPQGQWFGSRTFPTTPRGFAALLRWASGFGPVEQFGIEGTGSYGAGLARGSGPANWSSARSNAPNARIARGDDGAASLTPPTPKLLREPSRPARRSASLRPGMGPSR